MFNKTIAVALLDKNLFFLVDFDQVSHYQEFLQFWSKRSAWDQQSNLGRPQLVQAKCLRPAEQLR